MLSILLLALTPTQAAPQPVWKRLQVVAPRPMKRSDYKIEDDSEFEAGEAFQFETPDLKLYAMGGTLRNSKDLSLRTVADAYLEFTARLEGVRPTRKVYGSLRIGGRCVTCVATDGRSEVRIAAISAGRELWVLRTWCRRRGRSAKYASQFIASAQLAQAQAEERS